MSLGLSLAPHRRVFGAFFIYAFTLGALPSRIGDLQIGMGVGEGALGAALIGPAIGTLIAVTFAAPLLEKIGYRIGLLGLVPVLALLVALASLSPNPMILFAVLFVAGLMIGSVEVIINVEADRTEAMVGKRIMNRAHAFWSFGFFAGGLVGAFAKQFGISPQIHIFAMVPIICIVTLVVLGKFEPAPVRPQVETDTPRFAVPSRGILVLFAFTLSAMLLEGAVADWSIIFMRDTFDLAPFINASAFAIGAFSQAVMRYFADGFVDRFGVSRVARFMVWTLLAGVISVTFAPTPLVGLLGFVLLGVGSSGMFPMAMSAAAQRTDRPAAINVAALAQTAFVAFLIGPPLLGFVAEQWSIRYSFGVCIPFVILSLFTLKSLSPPNQGGNPITDLHA